jgi:hypothetical protein
MDLLAVVHTLENGGRGGSCEGAADKDGAMDADTDGAIDADIDGARRRHRRCHYRREALRLFLHLLREPTTLPITAATRLGRHKTEDIIPPARFIS